MATFLFIMIVLALLALGSSRWSSSPSPNGRRPDCKIRTTATTPLPGITGFHTDFNRALPSPESDSVFGGGVMRCFTIS